MPKSIQQQLVEKLTTRNLIAIMTTTTVMIVVLQMTFNAKDMLVIVQENAEWVITGAFIFGAVLAKWGDQIQFYFRKPSNTEPKPDE